MEWFEVVGLLLSAFVCGGLGSLLIDHFRYRINPGTVVLKGAGRSGTAYRVLLEDVSIYEGNDLHEAKRIRAACRTRGDQAELEAFGKMRG